MRGCACASRCNITRSVFCSVSFELWIFFRFFLACACAIRRERTHNAPAASKFARALLGNRARATARRGKHMLRNWLDTNRKMPHEHYNCIIPVSERKRGEKNSSGGWEQLFIASHVYRFVDISWELCLYERYLYVLYCSERCALRGVKMSWEYKTIVRCTRELRGDNAATKLGENFTGNVTGIAPMVWRFLELSWKFLKILQ